MTEPYLIPCLKTLRSEFNALSPGRDKSSDGWIGDAKHQSETSDHNPDSQGRVLAIDIDSTGPWPAPFGDLVESLRGDPRLEYVIWNRRIASRSQDWKWRTYTGTSDPHTNHAHFSARHDHVGQNLTQSWGLEEEFGMPSVDDIATAVWNHEEPDPDPAVSGAQTRRVGGDMRMLEKRRRDMEDRINAKISALSDKLDQVLAALKPQA